LKKHLPKYSKGDEKIFEQVKDKLETAKENAKKSLQTAEGANTDNPSTKIHELVEFVQNIKPI